VAILSPYPLSNIQRIVLPHEGPGGRRRVALGATVTLKNLTIRTYSVHSETRISVERKLEQMQAVLKDLALYPKNMPAVVLGDFNTWQGGAVPKTHMLFVGENFQTPFDDQPTFYRRILFFPLKLKLDWIWLRNLEVLGWGIEKRISLSDHWPMWCIVKVKRE
jgi:endonuclease/exonuclease/phosphatase family metal-dependent hydrolase